MNTSPDYAIYMGREKILWQEKALLLQKKTGIKRMANP